MFPILKLLRPKHWAKNLFLFLPIFFAGEFFNTTGLINVSLGFLYFCCAASSIYILNDLKDVESDRQHPKKKERPIANGTVSVPTAIVLLSILTIVALTGSFFLDHSLLYIIIAYLIINIFYTFGLKNIAILDLFLVASGFLFRTLAGGFIAEVYISHWLVIMIMLLSLFLVLAKRRDDIVLAEISGTQVRKSSSKYNLEFINSCLTMLSAVVIVAYIMYSVSAEVIERFQSEYLFLTSVFVIAGVMRYLQITIVEKNSGSPTRILFQDKFIFFTLLGWILMFFVMIYVI